MNFGLEKPTSSKKEQQVWSELDEQRRIRMEERYPDESVFKVNIEGETPEQKAKRMNRLKKALDIYFRAKKRSGGLLPMALERAGLPPLKERKEE